jgi:hypothetical protein
MEKKLGLFGMSPEEKQSATEKGAASQHQQRWMNTHPDFEPFVSTPCGLSNWQRARGIGREFRVKLSKG